MPKPIKIYFPTLNNIPELLFGQCVAKKSMTEITITPKWAGKSLALHKPLQRVGQTIKEASFSHHSQIWIVTHINTGCKLSGFCGSFERAKAFALEWDEVFAKVTGEKDVPAQLRKEYLAALRAAEIKQ